jgi:hypothetical protein
VLFQEGAQLGAGSIDLVVGDEVDADAVAPGVGEQADGQFAFGGEDQVQGQAGGDGGDRIGDLLGGDSLAGADQRVPGPGADVGEADGVDAVVDAACAAHVLALDASCGLALFLLAGLVECSDGQAVGPAAASRWVTAKRRTALIAPRASQRARFSRRWVAGGGPRRARRSSSRCV